MRRNYYVKLGVASSDDSAAGDRYREVEVAAENEVWALRLASAKVRRSLPYERIVSVELWEVSEEDVDDQFRT